MAEASEPNSKRVEKNNDLISKTYSGILIDERARGYDLAFVLSMV